MNTGGGISTGMIFGRKARSSRSRIGELTRLCAVIDCARQTLGVPEDRSVPMGVAVGHPGDPDPNRKSSPRVPLDELVNWGRWSD